MRGVLVGLLCIVGVSMAPLPARAAGHIHPSQGHTGRQSSIDWTTYDTAVYVVSTINLLRTRDGRPVVPVLTHALGVRQYDVYADIDEPRLYFIDLRKADGTPVGSLVYRMGAQKPMSLMSRLNRIGISRAPAWMVMEYRTDKETLIGSFSSTIPQQP